MDDLISRQAALDVVEREQFKGDAISEIEKLPSAQPDKRLKKIADLVDGTIDHFDREDAMDLLYQIKEVIGE